MNKRTHLVKRREELCPVVAWVTLYVLRNSLLFSHLILHRSQLREAGKTKIASCPHLGTHKSFLPQFNISLPKYTNSTSCCGGFVALSLCPTWRIHTATSPAGWPGCSILFSTSGIAF